MAVSGQPVAKPRPSLAKRNENPSTETDSTTHLALACPLPFLLGLQPPQALLLM